MKKIIITRIINVLIFLICFVMGIVTEDKTYFLFSAIVLVVMKLDNINRRYLFILYRLNEIERRVKQRIYIEENK